VMERVILPALESGEHIVLDRFWFSTMVYGEAGGIDARTLEALIEPALRLWGCQSITLFFVDRDAPIDRDDEDAYWQKLRRLYADLAKAKHTGIAVEGVSNMGALKDTVAAILKKLPGSLKSKGVTRSQPARDQIAMAFHPSPEPTRPMEAPTILSKI